MIVDTRLMLKLKNAPSNRHISFFHIFRKGIDPCAKFKKEEDSSKANKDYELPNTPPTNVRDDKNDQYAELDDPYLAGYEIPI